MSLAQRDYWRMSEEKLRELAEKYHIPPESIMTEDPNDLDPESYFDRSRVVAELVSRDTARRAGRAIIISLLALLIASASLVVALISSLKK
jgi:hypothetical protein